MVASRPKRPATWSSGAGVVITMLPTAEVILDLVEPLLDDWPEDTIWLQMSSVGAAEADQLTQVAEAHGGHAGRRARLGQHSSRPRRAS